MFRLEQLRYCHPGGTPISFPDWALPEQGHAVLVGPSGSGKTTLLSLLGGMLTPASGKISLGGQDLAALSAPALDRFRGQRIGVIPQRLHLIDSLTVAENLNLAQYLAHNEQSDARVDEVLARLGILDLKHRRTHQLSQGQLQRVAIARAVINRPGLLLADEPTASLDDESATQVIDLLESEARAVGASLLIASHDSRVKDRIATRFELKKIAP